MNSLLSINNYYYRRGGAEVVFMEQNRLLEEAGWNVIPFAMKHELNDESKWSSYFVDEIEFGNSYSFANKVGMAMKIAHSFEAQKKISSLVRAVRPSVAHAHNVYHHISPSIFSTLKRAGVPTVLTLHDLKIACPAYKMLTHDGVCERCKGGRIYNVVRHRCLKDSVAISAVVLAESAVQRLVGSYSRYVDKFVVPSRFYLEKFVEWGWPRSKFVHIPNFVKIEKSRGTHGYGDFLYIGRLSAEKGISTLIKAAAISGQMVDIVGTGPEVDSLKSLAVELAAPVRFLGYRSGVELFDLIAAARAVILPSEWYENAPISILEAYSYAKPVIGADIGGIPELIKVGQTGHVFRSGDEQQLAALLSDYAGLPDSVLRSMGDAAKEWVVSDFSIERYRARILDLYGSLTGHVYA
jgi:glycosyltransferase involved in cell wall biosynthesis